MQPWFVYYYTYSICKCAVALFLLCQLTVYERTRVREVCWLGELKSSPLLCGIQQHQVEPVVCVRERERERERECSLILPVYFTFSSSLPLVSPLCLSPSNKAEYLFPPLRLSGLLKGVGDWADIRRYVCVFVRVTVCMCMCVCARALLFSHSHPHAVLSACLITHPKRTVASSCVLTHRDWKLLILSRGDS